jgi:alkylation response protein AidB-like acyl-CoA dehydrogenase
MRTEVGAQLFASLQRQLGRGNDREPWSILENAGVTGLCVPTSFGGLGLGSEEFEPVFAAFGEAGIVTPCLETSVIAAGLLGSSNHARVGELLQGIANGNRIAVAGMEPVLISGIKAQGDGPDLVLKGVARIVADGMQAADMLVVLEGMVFIVGPKWIERRRPVPTHDGRLAADIDLTGITAFQLADICSETIGRVRDEATAMVCIEAAGIMRRLVAETVAFAKSREQFGQSIGTFQVVQHRLVDMNIQARRATAIAKRALESLQGPEETRAAMVSAAKMTIGRAGRFIGQNAVQLHGAMGMTAELEVGRLFKRLMVIESQLGDAREHLDRYTRLLLKA